MIRKKHIVSSYDMILIVSFVIIISLPLLKTIFTPQEQWSKTEKRELAAFPDFPTTINDVFQFSEKFETYFNDHFGFREKLVYRYYREIKKRFNKLGSPEVLQGEDGWLFYLADDLTEDFRGRLSLTSERLDSFVKANNKKAAWLGERGIHYIFFTVPDKQSIYPEYLPEYFDTARGASRSRPGPPGRAPGPRG